jgi:hypothetical protein
MFWSRGLDWYAKSWHLSTICWMSVFRKPLGLRDYGPHAGRETLFNHPRSIDSALSAYETREKFSDLLQRMDT